MRIVISSGHGKLVRGATGPNPWGLDERDENVRVVNRVAELLNEAGVETVTFHDNTSTSQSQNLDTIVAFHNNHLQPHDLDVSIHFNAYEETATKPMGCECLYVTQQTLADKVAKALSSTLALPNRGPKQRTDLAFLNGTDEPAILIETCFCDAKVDCDSYRARFEEVCVTIAETISGSQIGERPPGAETPPAELPPDTVDVPVGGTMFFARGKCSYFGGPNDHGVSASEGLAFLDDVMDQPLLFLPYQPEGTTGLARRLNPAVNYIACRWDYDVTSKALLASGRLARVRNSTTGAELSALPSDWGPHEDTGRVADLSPGLMLSLGLVTDDEVEVTFPWGTEVLDGYDQV